jgi:hypothetical protein
MNVLAAAVKRRLAIPKRRCVEGTKSRGIPIGVGSRMGSQKRFPEGPMGTRLVVFGLGLSTESGIGTMAMAFEMRWAITHPITRSRWAILSCGRRKR